MKEYFQNPINGLIVAFGLTLCVFVIKASVDALHKGEFKQKPHIGSVDTIPRTGVISVGQVITDSLNRIVEKQTNDIYSVYNYKKVPQNGLYTDTKQTNDSTASDVCSAVFIDGRLVHLVCVVQPLTHYGDKRIWYYTNHDKN